MGRNDLWSVWSDCCRGQSIPRWERELKSEHALLSEATAANYPIPSVCNCAPLFLLARTPGHGRGGSSLSKSYFSSQRIKELWNMDVWVFFSSACSGTGEVKEKGRSPSNYSSREEMKSQTVYVRETEWWNELISEGTAKFSTLSADGGTVRLQLWYTVLIYSCMKCELGSYKL